MTDAAATERIGDTLRDDIVLPFRTERSGVIGRVVRLGPAIDTILSRHDAPEPVSHTLGEAVALTVMLGTALKFAGKLTLQTKTDGLLDCVIEGRGAADVYFPAIERGLVSRLDHAAYLGRELARAEHALKSGERFVQDSAVGGL